MRSAHNRTIIAKYELQQKVFFFNNAFRFAFLLTHNSIFLCADFHVVNFMLVTVSLSFFICYLLIVFMPNPEMQVKLAYFLFKHFCLRI